MELGDESFRIDMATMENGQVIVSGRNSLFSVTISLLITSQVLCF